MSIEMNGNFEHMVSWEAAYADFRLAEQNAVKATKAEKILAMKSMRSGFEKMVTILAKHAGITDDMVRQVKYQMNKDDSRVDLYGRILALSAYGVLDAQSDKNYNLIRELGNRGTHDNEEPYVTANVQQIHRDMEMMYKLLYRETLLFANKYMKAEPTLERCTWKGTTGNSENKIIKVFSGIVVAVCATIMIAFVMSSMAYQNEMRKQQLELLEESRQKYEQVQEKSLFSIMLELNEEQ